MAEFSEAMKEAYASNPVGEVIVETIEFIHPSFVDDDDSPSAIRFVREGQDIVAGLEIDAPVQAGQMVRFTSFPFDVTLPGFEEGQTPNLQIVVDNVGREMTAQLEAATQSSEPIVVIYRPYLLTDLSGPQMNPPIQMGVLKATADLMKVSFTATLDDVANIPFPGRQYTPDDFPGLVR